MTELPHALRRALREERYKLTPQRLAIFEALAEDKTHPTAEEIYSQVHRRYPMVSLATVYKTLDLLKRIGLVHELGFADGSARYDPNVTPHLNVVCVKCKSIYDVQIRSVEEMRRHVTSSTNFKLLGQRLEFYGYCPRCI